MPKWEDISDVLSAEGQYALRTGKTISIGDTELKVGTVLRFRQDLSQRVTTLRVVRLDRKRGKLWAVQAELVNPAEGKAKMEKLARSRKRFWGQNDQS